MLTILVQSVHHSLARADRIRGMGDSVKKNTLLTCPGTWRQCQDGEDQQGGIEAHRQEGFNSGSNGYTGIFPRGERQSHL